MQKRNIAVIFMITLMAIMGVASLTPAFPAIKNHFNLNARQVTLLITVFTFPGIFLAPVAGILADRLGRKTILIPSLFLFGISGSACFYLNNWESILLARFLQGLGAASLGSLNVTLIGDIFTGNKRGEIMGYNASVLSSGTAFYPFIGGIMAMAGWQFPFLLPLLAIPTALLVIFWLKNPEPKNQTNFRNYLRQTWKNINKKTVWGLFIINVLLFVVLYGSFLSYFPQLMVERFGASTFQIGIFMSGFSIVTAITSAQKKRIDKLFSAKKQLNTGFMLYFFSMLILSVSNQTWMLFIPLLTFGIAHGMMIPGIQTLLVGFAPLSERAGFMSVNSMVLRIGQTLGPLFIGLFFAIDGVKTAFLGGALAAVFMLVISVFMVKIKKNPAQNKPDSKTEE